MHRSSLQLNRKSRAMQTSRHRSHNRNEINVVQQFGPTHSSTSPTATKTALRVTLDQDQDSGSAELELKEKHTLTGSQEQGRCWLAGWLAGRELGAGTTDLRRGPVAARAKRGPVGDHLTVLSASCIGIPH